MNRHIASEKLSRPIRVSLEDEEADLWLKRTEESQLEIARAHAKNWTGGLAALTGVLGTALGVEGPDTTEGLETVPKFAIAVLLGLAITLLLISTTLLYGAAHGKLGNANQIQRSPLTGLASRVRQERHGLSVKVRTRTAQGISLGLVAIVLTIIALFVSWFAPRASEDESASGEVPAVASYQLVEHEGH